MATDTRQIVIGQHVYSGFWWAGRGIVVRIHGEQRPGSCDTIGHGIVCMGGSAHFDVIYESGVESKMIPETILRNGDKILDGIATADEILDAIALAAKYKADKAAEATATAARRTKERADHRANNPHLKPGGSAAENIRTELKRRFPGVKFSVRSDHNSINVGWTDGPTSKAVESVTRRHKEGSFDGSDDSYKNDPDATFADVFGGVKYINENRDYGERENLLAAQLCEFYKIPWDPKRFWESQINGDNAPTLVRRILETVDLTGRGPVRLVRTAETCGRTEEFWTVEDAPIEVVDTTLLWPEPAPNKSPMVTLRNGRWFLCHEDGDCDYLYSYSSRSQAEKRLAKLGDGWAIHQPASSRCCHIVRDEDAKANTVEPAALVVSGPDAPEVVAFLVAWHENGRMSFERECSNLDYDNEYYRKTAKDGPRWIKLDNGTSGVFMLDKTTGLVYGIEAYGVPHFGKRLGTLAELTAKLSETTEANRALALRLHEPDGPEPADPPQVSPESTPVAQAAIQDDGGPVPVDDVDDLARLAAWL